MSRVVHTIKSNYYPYDLEFATTEKNVEENWGIIMNICDKAGKSSEDAKSYLRAIIKRLGNEDPHIGVKAITVSILCYI